MNSLNRNVKKCLKAGGFLLFCILLSLPFKPVRAATGITRLQPGQYHLLAGGSFFVSSDPGLISRKNSIFQKRSPGLTEIFYIKKGKVQRQGLLVPGILPDQSYLEEGEEKQLSVLGVDAKEIRSWYSSVPSIAKVDQKGLVRACSSGTTTIKCKTSDNHIYSTTVDVLTSEQVEEITKKQEQKEDPSEVLLSEESTILLRSGDKHRLKVSLRTKTGMDTHPKLTYETSDRSVVSVDSLGTITAKSDGTASVTCKSDYASLSFSVNVVTHGESGKSCTLTLLSGHDLKKHTYTLFKQNAHNYSSYDNYLAWHGCAHCSLATVLGAYNKDYAGIKPNEIISGIEKKYAPASRWKKEHEEHSLRYQMPLSLNGISQLLTKGNVKNSYEAFFKYQSAREDIINHLKTGNPVIIEVRQKSSKTNKSSKRWTNSYHTMVFLGIYDDNKHVLLCDSVDRSWYDDGQRYKIVTLDDVMEYMFTSTKTTSGYYYDGAASDGGYIKIYE